MKTAYISLSVVLETFVISHFKNWTILILAAHVYGCWLSLYNHSSRWHCTITYLDFGCLTLLNELFRSVHHRAICYVLSLEVFYVAWVLFSLQRGSVLLQSVNMVTLRVLSTTSRAVSCIFLVDLKCVSVSSSSFFFSLFSLYHCSAQRSSL